jgi:hypothetical protein
MRNKNELIEDIKSLPQFEFRNIAVERKEGEPVSPIMTEAAWTPVSKRHAAVCAIGRPEPVAFVSGRYKLIQHMELMLPLLEPIPELTGDIEYDKGFAIMTAFPNEPECILDPNDGTTIGLAAYNSVDKTSALNVKFCVLYKGRIMALPNKIANFRKIHMGVIKTQMQDYINLLPQVRTAWNAITSQMTGILIDAENFDGYAAQLDADPRIIKEIKTGIAQNTGGKYTLWELCMNIFDKQISKNYKSEVHKRKRIDQFVDTIFSFKLILTL